LSTTIEDRLVLLEAQVFELQNASGWVEDMTPQQGLRHAAFRAISGTAGTFAGDQMAAMKTELEAHSITVPPDFNGRLIAWLQLRLDSSNSDLNGLLVEWARAEGVDQADAIGSFDPTPPTIVAVAASADDAEEVVSSGIVSISGTSIALQDDRIAGFRFDGVEIPQGATIASAWIQFTSASTIVSGGTAAAVVDIYGENADDAAAFTTGAADISSRTQTTASVEWSFPQSSGASAWTIGYRGANQRTPDLATIVQEIVDRAGWASGNAMAFTLQHDGVGLGSRVVVAQDDDGYKQAVLYVDWTETAGVVQDGLVAEWRFDEGSGQVLTDYTGNAHHGQLGSITGADAADPTWTAQGLSFDGGDFVDCGTLGIAGTQPRTLIYVGRSSGTGSTQLMSAQWNESTSAGRRWTLRAVDSDGLKVRLEFEGGGQTSALPVVQNAWHFVGATQAGANANTCVMYANGASEAVTLNLALDTQNTFRFGRHNNLGQVCQFAYGLVYDRALSPAEVEQNRQALKVILASRGITLP
jgi:hypothetical protein